MFCERVGARCSTGARTRGIGSVGAGRVQAKAPRTDAQTEFSCGSTSVFRHADTRQREMPRDALEKGLWSERKLGKQASSCSFVLRDDT